MGDWDDSSIPEGKIAILFPPTWPNESLFGLGWHPSTQSFALKLEQAMKPGLSVLDFGTGSGILAIMAAKLGASEVVAVENDTTAYEYAQRAFELNDVKVELVEKVPQGQWDIVVANIGDAALALNRALLRGALKDGGTPRWNL